MVQVHFSKCSNLISGFVVYLYSFSVFKFSNSEHEKKYCELIVLDGVNKCIILGDSRIHRKILTCRRIGICCKKGPTDL
jgi:hypothetical protein